MNNAYSELAQKRWEKNAKRKDTLFNKTSNAREQKKIQTIEEKNEIINELQKKLAESSFFIQNLDAIKSIYPFVYHVFDLACGKVNRKGNLIHGIRYSLFIIPYVLILSLFGKKLALFLNIVLGFPVWKTITRWRTKYIQKYRICLDGTPESIENMIASYMSDIEDKRVVLAIDAASVSARVSVSRNGEVKGLLETKWTDESDRILSSPQEFATFVHDHENEIIRYFFVVHICPLYPKAKNFPIALIPKCSGNANKEIVDNFKTIIELVQRNLNVVGVAFDGDSGWLHLAKKCASSTKELILKSIFQDEKIYSLDKYVLFYGSEHPDELPFLVFEDLLHLIKCFRYRLCCGCGLCPSLFTDLNNFISKDNFATVGIPPWLLDDSKYLKMDDGLPLRLFTFENVEKCVLNERIDLAYALIPCTLLVTAIMDDKIDRSSRIEMLQLGYSIVFLYLEELEQYSKFKKNRLQRTSKNGGKCQHVTLMDKKFCSKFLSLCSSLVYVLKDPQSVALGSLGSHWLEHFFGQVRQASKGNDTYECFERNVYNAVLANSLEQEIGINLISSKRSPSSGSILGEVDSEEVISSDLSLSLHIAAKLHMILSPGVYCDKLFDKINQIPVSFEINDPIQYILLLLSNERPKPQVRTTVLERLSVSTGKSQKKNLSISAQLKVNSCQETNEIDLTLNSNEPSIVRTNNCRRSPRLKKNDENLIVSQELTPPIIVSATFNSITNAIDAKIHEKNDFSENVDQILKETIPEDIFEEEEEEAQFCDDVQLLDQKDCFFDQHDTGS